MSRIHSFVALAALLGLAGPAMAPPQGGFPPDTKLRGVSLEEVLTLGGSENMSLLQWTGVAADADGTIYVLDALDCALKKFDDRGRLVRKTGRKGQGPGEFQFPVLLALSGGRLFAADQRRLGIQVFDLELRFLRTIAASSLISTLAAAGGGRVAYKPFATPGQPALWRVVDESGTVASETVFMPKVDVYLGDSITLAFDGKGNVYTAYLFRDLIEKRGPQGRLLWSRSPRGGAASETEEIQGFKIASTLFWMDVALDPDGRVFVLAGGKTRNPGRDVLVFDGEGAPSAAFVLPQTSHCLHIDGRGFLYVRADEGVALKKYRLRYR
jgi:hypothetical protein